MLDTKTLSDKDYNFLKQLNETPYKFDFFQAVRRLECIYDKQLGHSIKPNDDPLRLIQEGHIKFAPSTIHAFTPLKDNKPAILSSYFFGLLGPQGPLPMHLTEYVHERIIHAHDKTLKSFLDSFHHRMLSFFYRAWADNQPVVNLDHNNKDKFKNYTGSFLGIGDTALQNRDELSDYNKLFMSGHLSCQTKHVQGLESLIFSFFKLPVSIKEFIGEWIELPKDNQCRLGLEKDSGTLGENIIVGSHIWEAQQKFRIIFGPLSYKDFKKFLPGKHSLQILIAMVKNYTGDTFNWDVQLILTKEEVPLLKFNSQQLGYSTWSLSAMKDKDADELIFTPLMNE